VRLVAEPDLSRLLGNREGSTGSFLRAVVGD